MKDLIAKKSYLTLRNRLDTEYNEVTTRLDKSATDYLNLEKKLKGGEQDSADSLIAPSR